jgi:hypothetical protein
MANWYNEHIASKRTEGEADFGIGTVIPAAGGTVKGDPTKSLLVVGGIVALGIGVVGYKLVTGMEKEQRRLSPRRSY